MLKFETHPPLYHHFLLLLWEERSATGAHLAWRLSLLDTQTEARIGFKNLNGLVEYLNHRMKDPSENL